jgi:hypothetical protein
LRSLGGWWYRDCMKFTRLLRATTLGLVSMLAPALGCDGDDGDDEVAETDDTTSDTGGELSYAADIQPIWDASCVTACHTAGGTAASVLDLSGNAYANIVDVNSGQAIGVKLIASGDAMQSYLVAKIEGNQTLLGGTGGLMPSGADALDAATIQLIKDWVDAGAPE